MDTETVRGKAVLVTVAGPGGVAEAREFPKTFREIFEFLAARADRFMCFNMDYDARAWLKFLPKSVWMNLYRYRSVSIRGFKVSYLDGKYFTVRRGNETVTLFDCCQHYQMSLKRAAEEVLKDEQKEEIPASWYRDMSKPLRNPSHRSRVLEYAKRDAEICRKLWATLDAQYRKLGVNPKSLARPLSPGQIAAGFFGDKIRFRLDRKHNAVARRGYRGGRIEVYRRGFVGTVYGYDLKSAYPWALSKLPDPRGCRIVESKKGEEYPGLYSIYCVRVKIPWSCKIPPIPKFISRGSSNVLVYPVGKFKTWITGLELKLLKREGMLAEILYGLHLDGSSRPWLTEIPRLFALRKTRPEISTAIKLVLNSVYGKFAQQRDSLRDSNLVDSSTRRYSGEWVNTVVQPGTTTNFFVAAYITAMVRIRLWETMKEVGFENCILSATDGLLSMRPLPRRLLAGSSVKLGDWVPSFSLRGKAIVVGTGVYSVFYAGPKGGRPLWHDKVRGFRPLEPLFSMLDRRSTRIRIKNRVAYTLGDYALHGSELNDMVEINRVLDVNFDVKRGWPRPWKHARQLLTRCQESKPLILLE